MQITDLQMVHKEQLWFLYTTIYCSCQCVSIYILYFPGRWKKLIRIISVLNVYYRRVTKIMRIACVLSPQRPIKFNQTRTWLPVSIGKRNSLKYRQLGRFNSSKNRNLRKKKRDTDCVSSVRKIPQHLRDNGRFCSWKDELREGQWLYMPGIIRRDSISAPAAFIAFDTLRYPQRAMTAAASVFMAEL